MNKLRPEVLAFAQLMEQRLAEKDAIKGSGWKNMNSNMLRVHASSKMSRLETSILHDLTHNAFHAVDLANYCMMIADVAGALELPAETAQDGWYRDDQQTFYGLMLISGHKVTQAAIASWSDEDCELVERWAMAIHLQASDNEGIEVPAVPQCVIPFLVR